MSIPTPTSTPSAMLNRRLRPAAQRGMGGASSMLRLSRSADTRLPSSAALSNWAERAGAMLDLTPMMVGPQSSEPRPAPSNTTARSLTQGLRGARS